MTQDEISRALADRNVRCDRSTVSKHVKSLSELKYVSPPPSGMYKIVITDKGEDSLSPDFPYETGQKQRKSLLIIPL